MMMSVDLSIIIAPHYKNYLWQGLPVLAVDYHLSLLSSSSLARYFHHHENQGLNGQVELYKMLLGQSLHVLAVDYRSFGDSSRVALNEQVS